MTKSPTVARIANRIAHIQRSA